MAAHPENGMPLVQVHRAGVVQHLPVSELAPGDRIVLQAGDQVPADCVVLQCTNLRIQEAALTGEAAPVTKVAATTDAAGTPICDAASMAYMGTRVVAGEGVAVVTATGPHTVWGRLAVLTRALPAGRRAR